MAFDIDAEDMGDAFVIVELDKVLFVCPWAVATEIGDERSASKAIVTTTEILSLSCNPFTFSLKQRELLSPFAFHDASELRPVVGAPITMMDESSSEPTDFRNRHL